MGRTVATTCEIRRYNEQRSNKCSINQLYYSENLLTVAQLLGHESVHTTRIYTTPSEQDPQQAGPPAGGGEARAYVAFSLTIFPLCTIIMIVR